jgi:hypothetical protein
MIRVYVAFTLFLAVLANSCLTLDAQTAAPPVRVTSCFVMAIGRGDAESLGSQMRVRFENQTDATYETMVWRATTPAGTIDFTDHGTFSPRVSIARDLEIRGSKLKFNMWSRIYPSFELMGPGVCALVQTVSKTGETWVDRAVAPAAIHIPDIPAESAPSVPTTFDNPLHDPIGIISCQFSIVLARAFGYVRFVNLSPQPIDQITFRAFFGAGAIDFVQRGTFAPNVRVRPGDMSRRDLPPHTFREYVTLESPTSCVAVNARYADKTVWQNPQADVLEPTFPAESEYPSHTWRGM